MFSLIEKEKERYESKRNPRDVVVKRRRRRGRERITG
jgi:hypothetical protein